MRDMLSANNLRLISAPSLLNYVMRSDHIDLLGNSLAEAIEEGDRIFKYETPVERRRFNDQNELSAFSSKIFDETRRYFNLPHIPEPPVLFRDNAIALMKQKFAVQGQIAVLPLSLITAGGLASVHGPNSWPVATSLILGIVGAEGTAYLRSAAFLPHALGYSVFCLGQKQHGPDIYRKAMQGDVSFLETD